MLKDLREDWSLEEVMAWGLIVLEWLLGSCRSEARGRLLQVSGDVGALG